MLYAKLLAQAKENIVIWDPYYQMSCKRLFCEIRSNEITVEVLTICQGYESKRDIQDFADVILSAIDKTFVLKCVVKVFALKKDYNERHTWASDWHDRYLIIDKEVYLVGTSMDAQEAKSVTFGIKRLTDTQDKNLVIDTYVAYRDNVKDVSKDSGRNPVSNGYICIAQR